MLINNKSLIKTTKRVDLTTEQETNLNEIPNIKNNLNDIKNIELPNLNNSIQTLETLVNSDNPLNKNLFFKSNKKAGKGCVVFITDDGHECDLNFREVFNKYNKKFCSAVIAGWVGTTKTNLNIGNGRYMNWEEIQTLQSEGHEILNDLIESKEQLSRTQKKINCLCIFDDCESCTNRKILYDNVQQQINKTIYQIINTLSIAGRSHEKNKPTIEYICIQHNILVGGSIKQFNTILLESNVIGFKYDSLTKRNKKYLEDKFGISFIDKIDNSDILRSTDFVYLRLTYPHKLIFYNRVVEI